MYLRVASDVKNRVEAIADSHYGGMRFAAIVNAMLKYFTNLENIELRDAMLGRGSSALAEDTIIHQAWADHAFYKEHWEWACEEYLQLAEKAGPSSGVWRFAQFRLGYCWSEAALELKEQALKLKKEGSTIDERYRAGSIFEHVREALTAGLTFYAAYSTPGSDVARPESREHAVVKYNTACIWSLMAEALAQASCRCKNVMEFNDDAAMSEKKEVVEEYVEEFKQHWEQCDSGKGENSKKIDHFVNKSMALLKELKEETVSLKAGYDFLFRFARTDPDFAFLRARCNDKFGNVVSRNLGPSGAYEKVFEKTKGLVKERVVKLGLEDDVNWP